MIQNIIARLFAQPWPLFLWLSALLLMLETSIFRDPALRLRLFAALTVTMLSIAVLGVFYYDRAALEALVAQLAQQPRLSVNLTLDDVLANPWTYTIVDALILVLFWGDTLRRWVRRAQGLPLNAAGTGPAFEGESARDLPRMEDLLSGDLMAGAALMLIVAVLMQPGVVAAAAQLAQSKAVISQCTVALPGACSQVTTLTFLDLVGGLIALSLGLLALAFSATLSGLGAVGAVNESVVEDRALLARDETSTESVSEQVSLTVVNTLRAAVDRRARLAMANLLFSLRAVVWPLLLFAAVVMLALLSRALQTYLHSDKSPETVALYLLPAVAWGLMALVLALAGVGVLTFSPRVVTNTVRFLGLTGFVVLLTFWIFSLALWGVNELLVRAALTPHTPFAQLGATTLLSGAALVGYGILAIRAARE